MAYAPAPLVLERSKPGPWNVEQAFVSPEYQGLWYGLDIFHPLWSNGDPVDVAGSAHGSLASTPPTFGPTPVGAGFNFDESDDYYTVPNHPDLNLEDEWTFAFYMHIPDNTGSAFQYFYSWDAFAQPSSVNLFTIESSASVTGNDQTDCFKAVVDPGGTGSEQSAHSNAVLPFDRPKVVVLRKKGDANTSMQWWVDGLDETRAHDVGVLGVITDTNDANIGRREDGDVDRFFGGSLIWWGKWKRALTEAEIRLLSADPFGLFRPNWDYLTTAAFDPANLQASVLGSDVTLTHDPSF